MKIKSIIPKSLFARFILIIIIPILIIQTITAYIFYNRHWDDVSFYMQSSLVGDVSLIYKMTSQSNLKFPDIKKFSEQFLNIRISKYENKKNNLIKQEPRFEHLKAHLAGKIRDKSIIDIWQNNERENVFIKIINNNNTYLFEIPRKRLYTPTTTIFISWMIFTSVVIITIALTFAKNQIRAIIRLAKAAEAFGTGQDIGYFKPEGALEVRKAGISFLEMKERIEQQINQTRLMLAGLSHDLRTPITRIKLQLAFLEQSKEIDEIKEDLNDMLYMINEYIDYIKNNQVEPISNVNVVELIKNIISKFSSDKSISFDCKFTEIMMLARPVALKRAISNVIENAYRYGNKIFIRASIKHDIITIIIEDNGPGIPQNERENIFKPFYRADYSRNLNHAGAGLGLAISKEIIDQHGGSISVNSDKIKLNGASFEIKLIVN